VITDALLPFQHFSGSYLALLLTAVTCAYVGVYVICKRVVFLGVALAEVSAAGVGFAFFTLAYLPHVHVAHEGPTLFELWHDYGPVLLAGVFAVGAVFFISWSRLSQRVSREALIGVAHDVLFVHTRHLRLLCGLAVFVLGVHVVFRRPIVLVAYDPEMAGSLGFRVGLWETLLFLTIGLTIAVTTWVGGVMLSFALLIVPAYAALLVSNRFGRTLALSVLLAVGAVGVGLWAAVRLDYPTPPTVTVALLVPLTVAAAERWTRLRGLTWAVALPGLLLGLAGLVVAGANHAGHPLLDPAAVVRPRPRASSPPDHVHPPHHDVSELIEPSARATAARELGRSKEPGARQVLEELLGDPSPQVQAAALDALGNLGDRAGADAIAEHVRDFTPDLELEAARSLHELGDRRSVGLWIHIMGDETAPLFVRDEAATDLRAAAGQSLGYDALAAVKAPANQRALEAWRRWYASRAGQ
jgi:ABC-type Mn2+/Zn2+ transport system permease subunit